MSEHETPESAASPATGIPDEALPDDLRPDEDNPLAVGLEPGETVPNLLECGKHAAESEPEAPESGGTEPDDADPADPDRA